MTAASEYPRVASAMFSSENERAVLSVLLSASETMGVVRLRLKPDDFYESRHGRIYAAMLALDDAGTRIDPLSVSGELLRSGEIAAVGGKDYIGSLIDEVPREAKANLEHYTSVILSYAKRRSLAALGTTLAGAAADPGIEPRVLAEHHRDGLDRFLAATSDDRLQAALVAIDVPDAEPVQWTVERLLPAGEIAILVGDGGSFKSTVAAHIAAAIAGGHAVFDEFATRAGPALIISAEDAAPIIRMRLAAFCAGHGWDADVILRRVHILAQSDASLADRGWQLHIEREVRRLQPAIVFADPLADLLSGDENSNSEMRPVIKFLRKVGRDSGAAVGVVHHAGKAAQDKRQIDRIRGASALVSASRTTLLFEYSDSGVAVHHLKSSRGPKLEPFVVQRTIDSVPGNRADWISARLMFHHSASAPLSRGETFVIAQTSATPGMTTSDLKAAAIGSGTSAHDISSALRVLESRGRIRFEDGQRGAKHWFSVVSTTLPGKVDNSTLPTLPAPCPATLPEASLDLAGPLRARGKVEDDLAAAGKVDASCT